MSLLLAIILGGFIGWLASAVMGRHEGIIMSVIIGVVGAFIGGLISSLITGSDKSFLAFSWMGLFWSFIGAVVLVAILNAFQRRPHHTNI